jgi:hypothetical protein
MGIVKAVKTLFTAALDTLAATFSTNIFMANDYRLPAYPSEFQTS